MKNDFIIFDTMKLFCQKYYKQELDKLGDTWEWLHVHAIIFGRIHVCWLTKKNVKENKNIIIIRSFVYMSLQMHE